ncbi:MAG: tRNA pseudouridine(55) synthase TruB [Dehalococcoidia bacterium]|nr:MAG: tRNA pseudouridine(55) synthase TruB [Dehalococcoidia bacterium]
MSGIFNIDKPAGRTSFQVVSLVRRLSGVRRVGHAGTLDPSATGVLVVCLGQATRLIEYMMETTKVYRAEVRLGITTDTLDATGTPLSQADPSNVDRRQVEEALTAFVGEIDQVPPMFSALKHDGEPLYRYARAQRQVERQARRVTIHRLHLLAFRPPLATIEVECGKGTYIRALAHDLGQQLGCGAHLAALARLKVGPFTLDDACSLPQLEAAFQEDRWQSLLHPADAALPSWPAVTLSEPQETAVRFGQCLAADSLEPAQAVENDQLCRAYSPRGQLIAILRYDAAALLWRPVKVFAAAERAQEP